MNHKYQNRYMSFTWAWTQNERDSTPGITSKYFFFFQQLTFQIQKTLKLLLHVPSNSIFDLPFQNSKSLEDKIGSVLLFRVVQMYASFAEINAFIHMSLVDLVTHLSRNSHIGDVYLSSSTQTFFQKIQFCLSDLVLFSDNRSILQMLVLTIDIHV